jgi:hypothetical protein
MACRVSFVKIVLHPTHELPAPAHAGECTLPATFAVHTDDLYASHEAKWLWEEILSNVVDQQFIGGEYPWSGHEQVLSGRLGLEHLSSAVRELDSCCD